MPVLRIPYGVHESPKHDEHFAHARDMVTPLVRETSQNSGDAWAEGELPVRMTFRFGRIEAERFGVYLEGLQPHLVAFPSLARLSQARTVRYLAIEDFETHGLRGPFDPRANTRTSDYVAFWHRYGISEKSQQSGGRHGLGKSRIVSASKLRMFFGITVRSNCKDRQQLLQGQICLNPLAPPPAPPRAGPAPKDRLLHYGKKPPFTSRAEARWAIIKPTCAAKFAAQNGTSLIAISAKVTARSGFSTSISTSRSSSGCNRLSTRP